MAQAGKNIEATMDGDTLVLRIDTKQNLGLSKSKKSVMVATTNGAVAVVGDLKLNINCYK